MYEIVFKLPSAIATLAPMFAAKSIKHDLELWRKLYNIPYKTRIENKFDFILTLALEKDVSWFALTWQGRKYDSIRKVQTT